MLKDTGQTSIRHPSIIATTKAGQVWCTPATSHIQMDPVLAMEFAKVIDEYRDALIWMSGSNAVGPEGGAHDQWVRIRTRLIDDPDQADQPT